MALVRWTLHDPTTGLTDTFPINPKEGALPALAKTITHQSAVAPDGQLIMFEGRDQPQSISFSGTILEQTHYDLFVEWFNKRRQILLTDDLGVERWVYFVKFSPKRSNRAHSPWYMTYDAEVTVLDWA